MYLVSRPGGRVEVERMRRDAAAVRDALVAGCVFDDACAAHGSDDADAAQAGARVLVEACARGMIVGVERAAARAQGGWTV